MDRPPGRGPDRRPRLGPDPAGRRRRGDGCGPATSRSCTGRTPSPGRSRRRSSATGSATSSSAGRGSTARREVKDALAYLRVLRSDTDSVSFERIINVPARAIGDKTIEVLRAVVARATGVSTWEAIERAAAARSTALAPRARAVARRVRGARPAAPVAGRRAAAAGAARRRPRGVGLPGDARRRLRGRRGALGEPARAALGHDPLRRPRRRRTPSTGCSRRPRSSPTRTRTRATPTRSR